MLSSHHSHSGQFCAHAAGKLEEMVQAAMAKGLHTLALTEHMPRSREQDLYPEETAAGITIESLHTTFAAYYVEARRLQELYRDRITLLVGTELEWIRPDDAEAIRALREKYAFDMVIGSVHFVHETPIDFDRETFEQAAHLASKSNDGNAPQSTALAEESLFADYFDAQYAMLQAVHPTVVGHFDLIRLQSTCSDLTFRTRPELWQRIQRNLQYIRSYGGLLEINTAGWRKGLSEPYPTKEICVEWVAMGGHFVLSDDSHRVEHIATCYEQLPAFLEACQIDAVAVLKPPDGQSRSPVVDIVSRADLLQHNLFRSIDTG